MFRNFAQNSRGAVDQARRTRKTIRKSAGLTRAYQRGGQSARFARTVARARTSDT